MKFIIETKRFGLKEVIFDKQDFHLIKDYTWHVTKDKGNFYARCYFLVNGKQKIKKMHRIIMGVSGTDKPHIDHKNENGLDNRRKNLRIATIPENSRNTGANSRNVSGYKGVSLYTKGTSQGKYIVRLRYNGKNYFGGIFNTAIEAAVSYNKLSKKYHGNFAFLNKIDKQELTKSKLFICPKKEPKPPKGKCGFYGVCKNVSGGSVRKRPFYATLKGIRIGYFETAIEAAKYYDTKSIELYGKDAVLNFKK